MDEPTLPPAYPPPTTPQRHGCLTAWLILIIVGSAYTVVATPFTTGTLQRAGYHASALTALVLVVCGVVNLLSAVALFRWMKIGFYGLVATSIVALIVNIVIGLPVISALLGLVGIAILYGVLQIGGPNKAWTRLR